DPPRGLPGHASTVGYLPKISLSVRRWIDETAARVCRAILRGMQESGEPFIGTEALQRGALSQHQLRSQYLREALGVR
ncbi:hypothetical protein, partial [Mycobacterium sp.]|uniref:hypothetical protein n=1 Tax=Mycobacterium sp. TaxID=1785 RepID=UPI003C72CA8D